MKPADPYRAIAVCGAVLFAVVSSMAPRLCAQEAAAPSHTGVPQDWSQHHIVFTRNGLAQHPDLISREPRVLHQAMQRWQAPNAVAFHGAAPLPASVNTSGQRDWKVVLGTGRLAPHMFPAKYSFDPAAAPDCNKDFVVFGLNTAGTTGGQANLVAFNNLYVNGTGTGFCKTLTAPTVLFAYNITTVAGGKITTSPVLSEDGTKIAFVESVAGASATFHVLTWAPGGTIAAAVAPTSMTSLTYSLTSDDTASSPWVDYDPDTAYVGADNGFVYQISGVFRGTPTLVVGSGWPVTVSKNLHLTAPVLDSGLGMLMVGSANGSLYQVNLNKTPPGVASLAVGTKGKTTPQIVGPPIVDVTNGTTFVVSAYGASSTVPSGFSAVLVQANTATMAEMARAPIGQGSTVGTPAPALLLYEPAFSNDYFNDPSAGLIRVCGTGAADTTPWQYAFGFTVPLTQPVMNTGASFSKQLLTSLTARCTGWTEFFNPNATAGPTDFFFFGLSADCTGTGAAHGCVAARTSDTAITTATVPGGSSGIVVDNYADPTLYPGAASIYLTAGTQNSAFKFTQSGLQ